MKTFRYSCLKLKCGEVTIFGTYGHPVNQKNLPAILHIHGGGQTNDTEAVMEWCHEGYAAMSFDWTGDNGTDRPAERIAFHPEGFEQEIDLPDAHKMFIGALAARNCITILAQMPEVNSNRIGIYGISWGGFITWLVNARDDRIKCAVPIYGTGGLFREGHTWNNAWYGKSDRRKRNWLRYMEPTNVVLQQKAPILHLNPTNDFFGGFDIGGQMLPAIDAKVDYTPNNNHNYSPTSVGLMRKFFEEHLRNGPETPETPLSRVENITSDTLDVVTGQSGEKTELWYSFGDYSHEARCWNVREDWVKEENGLMRVSLHFNSSVWLYVRKFYDNAEVSISSYPVCLKFPLKETASDNILYRPGSFDGLGCETGTERRHSIALRQRYEFTAQGISSINSGENFPSLIIRTPSDPKRVNYQAKELEIEVTGALNVEIKCAWGRAISPFGGSYSAKIIPENSRFSLKSDVFLNEEGESMPNFDSVQHIFIQGESKANEKFTLKHLAWK